MDQKTWLIQFEKTCGVKRPIFLNTVDTWEYPDKSLKRASELTASPAIGRRKLTLQNSTVTELWMDIDNKNGKFKDLKKLVEKVYKTLLKFTIPPECIYIKSSGRGFHFEVFAKGIRGETQYSQIISTISNTLPKSIAHSLGVDTRSKVELTRIRMFGAKNEKHYCSLIALDQLKRKKKYPTVKKPEGVVYPKIKLFKVTPEFIRKIHEVETEVKTKAIGTSKETDFELDGEIENLYKCPVIAKLAEKAKTEHHLTHPERLFILQEFSYFGEGGRQEVHKIMRDCSDYSESYTEKMIDDLMRVGRKPITHKWAQEMIGCPADCKYKNFGKSPIKLAWTPLTLESLKNTYRKWLSLTTPQGDEDAEIVDIIMAIALDRELAGDPVWLYFVAESGGTKTEIIRALNNWKVVPVDSLTSHTLVSGKVIKDPETGKLRPIKGLLSRLDGKILTIKDFTIVLTADPRERYMIFSQFRGAYDGYYAATYGTWDKPIKLNVTFTMLAGVTSIIDIHNNLSVILGERFLKVRHKLHREKAAKKAMDNMGKEKEMRRELQTKTKRFLAGVKIRDPAVPKEIFESILNLALFVAQIRMPLPHRTKMEAMAGMTPQFETRPEYATRIGKQLLKFSKLIAMARNKETVDWDDYKTVLRVGFNTCPQKRLKAVLYLYFNPEKSIIEIANGLHWYFNKTKRTMSELSVLWNVLKHTEDIRSDPLDITPTLRKYLKSTLTQVVEGTLLLRLVGVVYNTQNTLTYPKFVNGEKLDAFNS